MISSAFITGSRAYGAPREDSDWDIVVLGTPGLIDTLKSLQSPNVPPDAGGLCVREGRVNLIVVPDLRTYEVWRDCTDNLVARRPVSRELAAEHIKYELALRGLKDDY